MGSKREQLETLNMWGQKLTREEGLSNADKDNIHKDLALVNERFNKVRCSRLGSVQHDFCQQMGLSFRNSVQQIPFFL